MKTKIKEWYMKEYSTDELGAEINNEITFEDLFVALDIDVYEVLGVGDSVIRERCFEKLAEIMNVDYEDIYYKWLRA